MHDPIPPGPPRTSLFEDVIHYTASISEQDIIGLLTHPNNLSLAILNIIGAEWLSVLKYLTTRLTQIEWELEHPDFRTPPYGLDGSLRRLHPWRRGIPVYRAMINEVLQTVLRETNPVPTLSTHLAKLRADFQIILAEIDILDKRIESMINVATAIISLDENKRAMRQNQNLSRLTYLAVIFVPMSFVSSLFSMTTDLSLLTQTFWVYFVVAVPITVLALGVADWIHVKSRLQWMGGEIDKFLWRRRYDLKKKV
jgi:Mg2+ and Co2+ transporter CorA